VLALDQKRRNEYASLVNNSGRHLLGVVNGILDMSKIETDNFEIMAEPLTPAQVIAHCCELMALPAREAGVQLVTSAGGDLPEMIADRRALNQILLNLLSNAIRFSNRDGKIVVGARAEAGAVLFTVDDSGVGMSDDDLKRVGEPYFQAGASYDRRHGGTGLGLSIVKGLVRLHGGELSIRSRVGEGTRVTVRLPLDCEQSRARSKASAQRPVSAINRLNGQPTPPPDGAVDRLADPANSHEDLQVPTGERAKKSA
jgi:two-component system, cell cycle sensor histidine kinase DivJ